jgi:oligopeptide transport system substrate-binding protein
VLKNAKEAKEGELTFEGVGVKAIDNETLVIELANPSPHFLELVAQCTYAPLIDAQEKEPRQFNGPFLIKEWRRGDYLQLAPNPYYWDHEHISLKQIDILMVQNVMTAFSLFEKNEVDWTGYPLGVLPAELVNHLQVQNILISQPVARAYWMFLNTEKTHLSSPSIRRALSLALNRSIIATHVMVDGRPLSKPIPSMLLPSSAIPLKEDLLEAQAEFEQGLKELGLTKETFPSLTINYSQQANRKSFAEHIQEIWTKAFGIKIQLEAKDWNMFRSDLEKGLYEIGASYNAMICTDPLEPLERFTKITPSNFSKWVNPQYQEKISLAKKEKDVKLRMEYLADCEQILMDQMPFIPICSEVLLFAHHPDLKGYVIDGVGNIDFGRSFFNSH